MGQSADIKSKIYEEDWIPRGLTALAAWYLLWRLAVLLAGESPELAEGKKFLLAVFFCSLVFWLGRFRWGTLPFSLVCLAGELYLYCTDQPLSRGMVSGLLLLIAGELLRFKDGSSLRWFTTLLLLIAVSGILPIPGAPLGTYVKELGNRIGEVCVVLTEDIGDWGLSLGNFDSRGYGGFGQASALSDGEEREQLTLSACRGTLPLYLKGESFSAFDGKKWSQGGETSEDPGSWFAGYLNLLYANGVTKEEADCFSCLQTTTTITFTRLHTADVILPEGFLYSSLEDGEISLQDGNFSFTKSRRRGWSYKIAYLEIDYGNSLLQELLANAGESEMTASYNELEKYCFELYNFNLRRVFGPEEYAGLRDEDGSAESRREELLQLPEGDLTDLKELALSITEGCSNDFEKCMAIEAYVRRYAYDLTVPESGSDNFVQEFLLQTGRGYCVHFASAMVLLCRLNGIPARYAEGFLLVPGSSGKAKDYTVYSSDAHAWAEVYIEGYGFIAFEPTSSKANAAESGWGRTLPKEESGGTEIAEEEIREPLQEEAQIEESSELPLPETLAAEEIQTESPIEHAKALAVKGLTYLLWILGYLLIIFLVWKIIGAVRYHRMTNEEKMEYIWKQKRRYLKRHYPGWMDDKKTLYELAHEEDGYLLPPGLQEQKASFIEAIDDYYAVRFGGQVCTREMLDQAIAFGRPKKRIAFHI